jgi:hypothetical protein
MPSASARKPSSEIVMPAIARPLAASRLAQSTGAWVAAATDGMMTIQDTGAGDGS